MEPHFRSELCIVITQENDQSRFCSFMGHCCSSLQEKLQMRRMCQLSQTRRSAIPEKNGAASRRGT